MAWKDDLAEKIQKFATKHGSEVKAGISGLGVAEVVKHISSIPGAVWDLFNPSDFSEQEKLEVEKLLAKYGIKVSLTDLDNEQDVFMKLNRSLEGLSEDNKREFRRC